MRQVGRVAAGPSSGGAIRSCCGWAPGIDAGVFERPLQAVGSRIAEHGVNQPDVDRGELPAISEERRFAGVQVGGDDVGEFVNMFPVSSNGTDLRL